MKKYRAAMIGCGRIGHAFTAQRDAIGIYTHAEAYATCAQTELVAVCDRDPQQLDACVQAWQVEGRYSDAQELLAKSQAEIVSICTPDATHFPLARLALAAPATRAILLEKPLASSEAEAGTLIAEAQARDVVLAVNYSRRYAASHVQLRDAIQSGKLGKIQTVTGLYTKGVIHNGTHWFDLARFFFGEAVAVQAFPSQVPDAGEATLDVRVEFASGLVANLLACDQAAYAVFEMDIVGLDGRVRILDAGHEFQHSHVTDSPKYAGYRALTPTPGFEGGLRDVTLHAVEDLVHCLEVGPAQQPRCSGADALAAMRIAQAALQSAQSGQRVPLAVAA